MDKELADNPKPPRRGRRFLTYRIRTLLVLVALAAVGLYLYRAYVLVPYRQQQAFLADIAEVGGSVKLERIGGDGEQRKWTADSELALLDRIVEVDLFNNGWRRIDTATHIGMDYTPEDFQETDDYFAAAGNRRLDWDPRRPPGNPATIRCIERFGRLPGLRRLSLRLGAVNDDDLAALRGASQLEHLDLGGTWVTNAGLAHLAGLSGLKHLSLACCAITDEGLQHLGRLVNLETLDLSGTRVSGPGLRVLWGHEKLRWLRLDESRVTHLDLRDLPHLESLNVLSTPLETVRLTGVDNLRALDLFHTPLADDALQALRQLTSLERIDLSATLVRGEGLRYLGELPQLRILIVDNHVDADSRLALQRAIPGLELRVSLREPITQ